jgi:CheY-like chemotaxis protein
MDGYELARRLRERVAGIQLIAMTGYGQDADRCRSRDAGFVHHLVKPFDLAQVATILDGVSG